MCGLVFLARRRRLLCHHATALKMCPSILLAVGTMWPIAQSGDATARSGGIRETDSFERALHGFRAGPGCGHAVLQGQHTMSFDTFKAIGAGALAPAAA
jgi:hypothetical protein